MKRILVTGAGGFIGGHLCAALQARGHWVCGVDIRPVFEWIQVQGDEGYPVDVRDYKALRSSIMDCDWVFNLAADMGGMGYISQHDADIMRNNQAICSTVLAACHNWDVERYFFSSSACVYPNRAIGNADLTEADAYPAQPDNEYGWQKLYHEREALAYARDYGMQVRIARFENTYGTFTTWRGGREKAPAALCRKVAEAKQLLSSGTHRTAWDRGGTANDAVSIDVWGDGQQQRAFISIDDLVNGIIALMESDVSEPVNLSSMELVSIDELAYTIADVAGIELRINHVAGPVGVAARNPSNAKARELLGWEPRVSLREGIARLYPWVEEKVREGNDG